MLPQYEPRSHCTPGGREGVAADRGDGIRGPPAHIALLRRLVVDREGWLESFRLLAALRPVLALAADASIHALAAAQLVPAGPPDQPVLALASVQDVVASLAADQVLAAEAADYVVGVVGVDHVRSVGSRDRVRAVIPDDRRLAPAAPLDRLGVGIVGGGVEVGGQVGGGA